MLVRARIPLERLADYNPLVEPLWLGTPIFQGLVRASLRRHSYISEPFATPSTVSDRFWGSEAHAARIAYLVRYPKKDPIVIHVGSSFYRPDWPILDGNHRLAAAFYRELTDILADVSGDPETLREYLDGIECVQINSCAI